MANKQQNASNGLWYKCEICNEPKFSRELARNLMICSKCGHHFPIRAADLLEGIFDKDEFVKISRSNLVLSGRLFIDEYRAIAVAIDNPQVQARRRDSPASSSYEDESECQAFMDAVELSIEERIPFISMYANLTTIRTLIQPQMASLVHAVNRLSKMHIPFITVLVNANQEVRSNPCGCSGNFISYFPMGDIVVADNPKISLGENSAPSNNLSSTITAKAEMKISSSGILSNELDSDELLIDMRIDRRKLANLLEKLVAFFH